MLDKLHGDGSLSRDLKVDVAIGEGTFSTVYLARDKSTKEKFALKHLVRLIKCL